MRYFRRNEEYSEPGSPAEKEMMARAAEKKMGEACIYLTKRGQRPYLTPAMKRLKLVPKYHDKLRTAAVDSYWRLYFHPVFVVNSSVELLSAVVEHEIWHLLLSHHRIAQESRIPNWAATLWNLAADAEIHNDASLFSRLTNNGFQGVDHKSLGSPLMHTMIEYFDDLMERAVVYKTGKSYEVFINCKMPQEMQDAFEKDGEIEIVYKGPQVK